MAVDGIPTYQVISGTTAAVVSTGAVQLVGVKIKGVDSGSVTIGDGATAIFVYAAVGEFDWHGVGLDNGLKVTTSTDGDVTVIYKTL